MRRNLRDGKVKGVRGLWRMAEELRRGQENVLPHDLLRNNRAVDDVFWNGPDRRSRVQRVGAFLMGFTLFRAFSQ